MFIVVADTARHKMNHCGQPSCGGPAKKTAGKQGVGPYGVVSEYPATNGRGYNVLSEIPRICLMN
jgi:hypothetical protein